MKALERFQSRLSRARNQEEVDAVVRAARNSRLSDDDFQSLMRMVLNKRSHLPSRYGE